MWLTSILICTMYITRCLVYRPLFKYSTRLNSFVCYILQLRNCKKRSNRDIIWNFQAVYKSVKSNLFKMCFKFKFHLSEKYNNNNTVLSCILTVSPCLQTLVQGLSFRCIKQYLTLN